MKTALCLLNAAWVALARLGRLTPLGRLARLKRPKAPARDGAGNAGSCAGSPGSVTGAGPGLASGAGGPGPITDAGSRPFPVTDHFDGKRFRNPWGDAEKSFPDMLRWMFSRGSVPWPARLPVRVRHVPPERVHGQGLRVTVVGHATVLIQTGGVNILTDPVWAERAGPLGIFGPRRTREPGLPLEALPPIDAVLVTHNHYDHLDLKTLTRLQRLHAPRFIAPLGNCELMAQGNGGMDCTELDWWQPVELAPGVRVHAAPAHHWSARGILDRRDALWCSFVIEAPGGPLAFFGDTGYGEGQAFRLIRERFGDIRLALLPIGAYKPRWFMSGAHMNPEEAVLAMKDLGAKQALALHHGVFKLTDEGIDTPLKDLRAALKKHEVADGVFLTPEVGEPVAF